MRISLFAALLLYCMSAYAQKPIYKCEINGKISYSNDPCIGAKMIDATPTEGAEYTGKKSLAGAMRDEREQLRDALQPMTGLDKKDYHKLQDREKLSPKNRAECYKLDNEITPGPGRSDLQVFQARKQYEKLNC